MELKNPKSRAPKRDPKASRTTTTQIAMKDNNRGLDNNLSIVTSKLAPHEIPPLNLKLKDVDIFEIPDSIIEEELGHADKLLAMGADKKDVGVCKQLSSSENIADKNSEAVAVQPEPSRASLCK